MWIIPSQLLKCAPDMEALDLASKESLARDCEPSHIVSLRGSLKPISSVKWRRDSWMRHLFGTILRPSLTGNFTASWTSLLRDTLASHSPQRESGKGKMTQGTSGHTSETQLELWNPECVSLKMSKDIFRWDSPQSSAIWKNWVTRCRGEYSARVKSARLTKEKGSSSWPTASSRDWKGSPGMAQTATNPDGSHRDRTDQLARAVYQHGQAAPENPSTLGSLLASVEEWRQIPGCGAVNQWGTPSCMDTLPARSPEALARAKTKGGCKNLREEVVQWGTPTARDHKSGRGNEALEYKELTPMVERQQSGKLNPRWVETLMGLPVGWVMPSCKSPVTIAPTNSGSLETELCQPPQSEHSEF